MKQLIFFTTLLLLGCCKKKSNIEFIATNKYNLGYEEKLITYNDSSFELIVKTSFFKQTIDTIKGRWRNNNDEFIFSFSEKESKAIKRNGFLEFSDIELKLKLDNQEVKEPKNISFFHFNPLKYPQRKYNYDTTTVKSYELNSYEQRQVDSLIKVCFVENKNKLENFSNYLFQAIPTINNGIVEVWIYGYCKDISIETNFRFRIIEICDGGNCNIGLKLNLTKKSYFNFVTSGEA